MSSRKNTGITMILRELTNDEKNELNHFKLRPNDCAFQVVLAVIASDFFDEEKLQRELSYKDYFDTFLDFEPNIYESFWCTDMFVQWILRLQGKKNPATDKTVGIALGIYDIFYNCSTGPCGKIKKEIENGFNQIYDEYFEKTGKYFESDPEFAYSIIISILESFGISRTSKKLNVIVDVSNIPSEQY